MYVCMYVCIHIYIYIYHIHTYTRMIYTNMLASSERWLESRIQNFPGLVLSAKTRGGHAILYLFQRIRGNELPGHPRSLFPFRV